MHRKILGSLAVLVLVPKAAMHHHDNTKLPKHKIRGSRQATIMKPIPKSTSVQVSPHGHLRFRVATPYAGHHSRPHLWCDNICQSIFS